MSHLFDVYPIYDIEPVKAEGSYLWDQHGTKYLDLYGGHAVISVGHCHPYYVDMLTKQLNAISFYSNSVKISLQEELAEKLGALSGYPDYKLFLCNSGAEANENALKLASFHNGRKKVISFTKSFHGRTAGAVAATDNASIVAPVNYKDHVTFLPFNDVQAAENGITDEVCAVIVEGIQGVGGINVSSDEFLQTLRRKCDETGAVLILDSVQCGYGRTGKFFSHQFSGIDPDIISMAKGMGNGFPIGGILISPKFKATYGMLGTTFGGNHLACAAGVAVLDIMKDENLLENAAEIGDYLLKGIEEIGGYKELRGRGLMIGIEYDFPVKDLRNKLLFDYKMFTGVAGANTIRLLPSLALGKEEADQFLEALKKETSVAI
ncbi:aminotransferase class III-fold pyridoxal phosphate-dependent enzyme [Dyadobacter chenwenxiniae]|uniref:Aminotransferase class III-fold pyridoxal phosphate-dependent enzyme n=1 Tax=Dyadobacter chenwenxiniae TaxID=2906456 RepID=A0A9X1TKS7_9BACT|nr:aminotransferase class III-fold pyridoxal phosphate-dependent enzyme [Dyadobacter chenwenxiniae]MCF0061528.1 aminotransferase class III-fold pyridoxal phosphate-dependent enzyme [Dyadobacter chenwenxiniae]UON81351.1 aminotransferase class III-fold pyridoxal phosphate-dependent enzyme [Dyadobacter chenwenxiniae]